MTAVPGLGDVELSGKKVLIRVDFNVPIDSGEVSDDTRIRACLPTLAQAKDAGAGIILMSHLGRPKEGEYEEASSLLPVTKKLSSLLNMDVPLIKEWEDGVNVSSGEIVMLENVRFNVGEKSDDEGLSKKLASLCDVFVNDAFATAHRAQASTHGVARFAPVSCAGPLLMAEIEALGKAFENPQSPMVAIVGGSKVSTKLTVLKSLLGKIDQLIIGGGIANTFLKASGFNIGNSLYEEDLLDEARNLQKQASEEGRDIPLPVDVVCGKEFDKEAAATVKNLDEIEDDDLIMDVGPRTAKNYAAILQQANTIVWNGPLGVFEFDQFGKGTEELSKAIAQSKAFSVAGGGDTLAAISKYKVSKEISYISTGGGAFLEFLEGKSLPAIAILEEAGD